MASTLKINTLTGVTTAGSIAVTGEGNSTTTNLQQGLAKQFSVFDQNGATIGANTAGETFNTSSQTDESTAVVLVGITNNMSNTTYIANNSPHYDRTNTNKNYPRMGGGCVCTTSSYKAVSGYGSSGIDDNVHNASLLGDLA